MLPRWNHSYHPLRMSAACSEMEVRRSKLGNCTTTNIVLIFPFAVDLFRLLDASAILHSTRSFPRKFGHNYDKLQLQAHAVATLPPYWIAQNRHCRSPT
jgi:hypothetical protein